MTSVGIFEAKNRLCELVERAAQGEEIAITQHGKPVAKLVPMPQDTQLFGALAGSVLRAGDIQSPIDTRGTPPGDGG